MSYLKEILRKIGRHGDRQQDGIIYSDLRVHGKWFAEDLKRFGEIKVREGSIVKRVIINSKSHTIGDDIHWVERIGLYEGVPTVEFGDYDRRGNSSAGAIYPVSINLQEGSAKLPFLETFKEGGITHVMSLVGFATTVGEYLQVRHHFLGSDPTPGYAHVRGTSEHAF